MGRNILTVFFVLVCAGASLADPLVLTEDPPATRTAALEEIWRIGGEDDEDILLGVIVDGVRDDSGQVYLLDNQLVQVLVISPEGELVATIGREGEGPGELRRPSWLFLTPEGPIGVVGRFPGKVVLLNLDDTPAGEITFDQDATEGGFHSLNGMTLVGDQLVGVSSRGAFDQEAGTARREFCLAIFNRQGEQLHRIAEFQTEHSFQNPVIDEAESFSPFRAWAVAASGLVYTTPEREAYRIRVHGFEGNVLHEFTREYSPRKRTQEDKDRLADGFRIIIDGERIIPENKAQDHDPAIEALAVAADGRLFVTNGYQSGRLLPEGVAGKFDVISPEGQFIEELTLTLAGANGEQDRLIFLDGEHFLIVHNFESAQDARRAGFGQEQEAEILEDVEPLEVGYYVLSK